MSVDHLQAMLDRLIQQFKGLPNLQAFFTAFGNQLNDVEEFYGQLMNDLILENAIGTQLDNLGAVLNQGRNGLTDDDYRAVLQSRIVEYQSNGTIEDLIQIMLVLGGANQVQLLEDFPAGFQITARGINSPVANKDIVAAILQAKLAGVQANIEAETALPIFQLDLAATAVNDGLDKGHIAGPLI